MIPLLLVFVMLLGFTACQEKTPKRYEAQFLSLFDTVTTLVSYTDDKAQFEAQAQFIHDKLERYHQLYDVYHEYEGIHNIKTINDQAGIAPVKVDAELIQLLVLSKEMYEKSNGKMNVAFGSVLSIWHTYREKGIDDPAHAKLPPMEELQAAALHTDIEKVIIDEKASTVFLADPEMRLDVGSIGKGYAVQQVSLMAQEHGFTSGLISVGGNIVAIGGKYGDDTPWNIGIENPTKEEAGEEKKLIATVNVINQSVVSSGDYQRYYTVDGKQYHHIIDPSTLMPAAYYKSVSIVAKDSGIADAVSTALFNMPLAEGKAFIESLPYTEACFVLPDNHVEYSSGFQNYLSGS